MDNKKAIDILEEVAEFDDSMYTYNPAYNEALQLAIATLEQQEKAFDEWCYDCKEYDKNRHCCPRFSKVIRGALDEVEQQRWIPVTEKGETDGNI